MAEKVSTGGNPRAATAAETKAVTDADRKVAGGDYFDVWRSGSPDDHSFKEQVLKDAETISLVSALVMTIGFAALLVPVHNTHYYLRLLYLAAVFTGIGFSLLGSLISVRTVMLINKVPAHHVVNALRELGKSRPSENLNAFTFTWYSLGSLLTSTAVYMLCEYSVVEFGIAVVILSAAGAYLMREDKLHHEIGKRWRGRAKRE